MGSCLDLPELLLKIPQRRMSHANEKNVFPRQSGSGEERVFTHGCCDVLLMREQLEANSPFSDIIAYRKEAGYGERF